jgi:hypothetical protein
MSALEGEVIQAGDSPQRAWSSFLLKQCSISQVKVNKNAMNFLKSLPAATISLIALAALIFFINSLINGGAPSTSTVKAIVTQEMGKRFKGCVIKSITITRGGMFLCQGHQGMAAYGTPIYPTLVKVVYTMAAGEDSRNETREFHRTLFLYKSVSHQWARDTDLN